MRPRDNSNGPAVLSPNPPTRLLTRPAAKRPDVASTVASGTDLRPCTRAGCAHCGGQLPPRRRRFCSDLCRIRGQRAERRTENADYGAAVVRMIGGMGRRASADLYALRSLADAVGNARRVLALAVAGARAQGYSDGEIAAALGCSRQAVGQRFGRKRNVDTGTAGAGDPV